MPYTTPGHLGTGAAVTVVITAGGFYRLAGDGAAFGAGPGGSDHARGQGPWPGQRGSSSARTMAKAAGSATSRTAAASDKFPGSEGGVVA